MQQKEVMFKYVLQSVREELDDHLETINNNTVEIESNNELLHQIMLRIEKISERMDSMALYLKRKDPKFTDDNLIDIKPLTKREKEVFCAIYELNAAMPSVSYRDLAKQLNMPVSLVQGYISALIGKGIPITKQYAHRTAYLSLKPQFQRLQAKKNIVGVDAKLTAWL